MVQKIRDAKEDVVSEVVKQLKKSVIWHGKQETVPGLTYNRGDIEFNGGVLEIDVDDIVAEIVAHKNLMSMSEDNFGNEVRAEMVRIFKARARKIYSDVASIKLQDM